MVEDEQALLGFIDADVAQLPGFFLGQVVAAENLFRNCVGEAFDHLTKLQPIMRTEQGCFASHFVLPRAQSRGAVPFTRREASRI